MSCIENPPIPYIGNLSGLAPGWLICVAGQALPNAKWFAINFQLGPQLNPRDDIALHISPRFEGTTSKVVRNSLQNQNWGLEENFGHFPFAANEPFEIMVLIEHDFFKIAINGQHYTEFRHRLSWQRINTLAIDGDVQLYLIRYEIMSAPSPNPAASSADYPAAVQQAPTADMMPGGGYGFPGGPPQQPYSNYPPAAYGTGGGYGYQQPPMPAGAYGTGYGYAPAGGAAASQPYTAYPPAGGYGHSAGPQPPMYSAQQQPSQGSSGSSGLKAGLAGGLGGLATGLISQALTRKMLYPGYHGQQHGGLGFGPSGMLGMALMGKKQKKHMKKMHKHGGMGMMGGMGMGVPLGLGAGMMMGHHGGGWHHKPKKFKHKYKHGWGGRRSSSSSSD